MVASVAGASCTTVPIEPADSGVADRATVDVPALDARSEEDATSVDAVTVDTMVADSAPVLCASNERVCSGACTDVQENGLHCGMCDRACAASETCVAGMCRPSMMCTAPETACGGGCVNVMTDTNHCGACGIRCMPGQRCASGRCAASRCPVGQSDCTPSAAMPTCVDVRTNGMNCGACGNTCPAGEMCAMGVCQPTTCATGTRCVVAGVASCRNLQIDRSHCGMCNNACAAGELCVMGACRSACTAPMTSCPVGMTRACVDLQTDEANCGACGTACAASQVCTAGRCGCAPGRTMTPSGCVDLQTDESNCGMVGRACATGATCTAGMCACPTGLTACDGRCVDLQSSATHCGMCRRACAVPTTCSNGTCNMLCAAPTTSCGGRCILASTFQNDENNCGRCGNVCRSASRCNSGVCGPSNDVRTNARTISLDTAREVTVTGSTENASHDGPSVPCTCTGGANVWYTFRTTIAGVVYFDTAGSAFDTSLFLTDSAGVAVPAQSANGFSGAGLCNDDSRCGMGGGFTNENQARLAGYLNPGTYYLAVGGCGTGSFTLHAQFVSESAGRNFVNNRILSTGTQSATTLGTESSLYASSCGGTAGAEHVRWYLSCGASSERQLFSLCRSDGNARFARFTTNTAITHDPVLYARSAQTGATLSCVDNTPSTTTVDCRGFIDLPPPSSDDILDGSHVGARLSNLATPRGLATVSVDTRTGGPGMAFSLYAQLN
ncbi:MAG: hypothetical protein JNK05_25065 [Myxococcales bacterium]|nr:hypothetical protein [Myxococcales bacterium]